MKYPFTVRQVREWAASKRASKRYEYTAGDRCALAQFLRETGIDPNPLVLGDEWLPGRDWSRPVPIQKALMVPLVAFIF